MDNSSATKLSQKFAVRRLSNLMAAEITGLNLSASLDPTTQKFVHNAFLDYQLLLFRHQALTKEQQITFTKQFGNLEKHTVINRGTEEIPLVHIVSNLGIDGKPTGRIGSENWHSDKSFRPEPSMATILHAVTLPPKGGDTVFVNMYAAYQALDERIKQKIYNLKVVHSWRLSRGNEGRTMSEEEVRDAPDNSHPLVRIHPETGRRAIFVGTHASHIEGMPFAEGRKMILDLENFSTQSEFIFRHKWRPGDLLMWDNRCLLHRADNNFDAAKYPRILHRTCLRGTSTFELKIKGGRYRPPF